MLSGKMKKLAAGLLAAAMVVTTGAFSAQPAEAAETKTASVKYVEKMGSGWNLGNTFDGFVDVDDESEPDKGEVSWGNPKVTKKLIQAIKKKVYKSIRMPLTLFRRYEEKDGKAVINKDFLARYHEVVDWAVDEGLYVMINIHHDSWKWMNSWDGKEESREYIRFTQLWEQLADEFKDDSDKVCFETLNEPQFNEGTDEEKQAKLDKVNQAAYDMIRKSGGKNDKRMIILPTINTGCEQVKLDALYNYIKGLNDKNVVATVHYYSEWVYSANLGTTGLDDELWKDDNGKSYTPRMAADDVFARIKSTFTDNGIGVIIGEWGLLGYDAGDNVLQSGEELKYYEYMNYKANKNAGVSLMFWDNGSGIDRNSRNCSWKKPLVGKVLEASLKGRSSYAAGLDTVYFSKKPAGSVKIKLALNGNKFKSIRGLKKNKDYTYNSKTKTITLKKAYVQKLYKKMGKKYGQMADLQIKFSSGADWHEYLVKNAAPTVTKKAEGTTADGIVIPVNFKGSEVRRITACEGENRVGPNSGWRVWLQRGPYVDKGGTWDADEAKGTLTITSAFFNDESVADGIIELKVECYDGKIFSVYLNKTGETVAEDPKLK